MAFVKTNTEHFCVLYDPIDRTFAVEVIPLINDFYNKVAKDTKQTTDGFFEFYLCPDVESYIEITHKTRESYQEWMIGWTDFNLKRMCILSPRVIKDRTSDDVKKVICHEIVHIVFDSLGTSYNTELWLSEGIATLLANQIELEYVSSQNFPLIKELLGEDNFIDNGGYDYCGIYVWYFILKYGMDCFKKVYVGKECVDNYLFATFEKEAINNYIAQNK